MYDEYGGEHIAKSLDMNKTEWVSDGYIYDFPGYDAPIIFGLAPQYIVSIFMNDLIHDGLEGPWAMDFDFVTLGTDARMTDFVDDLYSKRLPFVASMEGPSIDFANGREFAKVSLPRNPSNSILEECFSVHSNCSKPMSDLGKLANPKMADSFPEMLAFIEKWTMMASDVNKILQYQHHDNYAHLSNAEQHESWLDAACQWLQENRDSATVKGWSVSIQRYDCINGCGLSEYLASNGELEPIKGSRFESKWLNNLGGRCEFDSKSIVCTCLEQELYGAECQLSCPGLRVLMLDEDTLSISHCSGRGVCDPEYHTCDCQDGFGGDGCQTPFTEWRLGRAVQASFHALFAILSLFLMASIGWIWKHQWFKQVSVLHVKLTTLMTAGQILICCGFMLSLSSPHRDVDCVIETYLIGLGATAATTAPMLKAYRVWQSRTVRGRRGVLVPDQKLVASVYNALIAELAVCVLYTILHQNGGGVRTIYNNESMQIETVCNDDGFIPTLLALNYAAFGVLLCGMAYYSWKVRNVEEFVERKCSFMSSFGISLIVLLMIAFSAVTEDAEDLLVIHGIAVSIGLAAAASFFWIPRIYHFHKYPEMRVLIEAEERLKRMDSHYAPSFLNKGPRSLHSKSMATHSENRSDAKRPAFPTDIVSSNKHKLSMDTTDIPVQIDCEQTPPPSPLLSAA